MTEYFPQGYPLLMSAAGDTRAVVGWHRSDKSTSGLWRPITVTTGVDADGAWIECDGGTFSVPTPVRELIAELNAVLDRAEWFDDPADRFTELTKTLRALLVSWS
jgi:hypothetical protein